VLLRNLSFSYIALESLPGSQRCWTEAPTTSRYVSQYVTLPNIACEFRRQDFLIPSAWIQDIGRWLASKTPGETIWRMVTTIRTHRKNARIAQESHLPHYAQTASMLAWSTAIGQKRILLHNYWVLNFDLLDRHVGEIRTNGASTVQTVHRWTPTPSATEKIDEYMRAAV
jgi:hypothetical protein